MFNVEVMGVTLVVALSQWLNVVFSLLLGFVWTIERMSINLVMRLVEFSSWHADMKYLGSLRFIYCLFQLFRS